MSSQHEVGGFFGYAYNSIIIDNCINAGDIVGDGRAVGGFVGVAYGNAIINKSYNTGEILSASLCGGLVGAVYGYGGSSITNCFNTGSVSGAASSSSAGGLIGGLYGTTSIINSYNTGNVHGRYSGGLVGDANRNTLNVSGFYNTGYLVGDWYIGTIYGTRSVDCQINISSSFCLNESLTGNNRSDTFAIPLNTNEMQNIASFDNWDFDTLWDFDSCAQNSYPVLRDVSLPLTLNYSNKVMRSGETIQLVAYKNGVQTDDVEWSISAGVGSVTSNGRLTPGCGPVTVVATDAEGNKANFNAYVFVEATSVNVTNKTLNIAYGSQNIATSFDVLPDIEYKDYIINYESSNESVAIVDKYGTLTPISAGFVEITATTIGGVSSKMTVTIVADATQISLPNTFYVERGETQKIPLTVLPNPTTSEITWTSSDVTVATVDSEGNIKGIKSGKTIITVTTHNGLSATSTVTVKAPITEMAFETPSLTLYIGDEYNTQLNIIPTDTTDTITYSSSNSYTASVSTKGVITAKQAGFVTITATSSSGQKAYCNITIKQWPSVVTLVDSQASIDKDIITTNTTAIRNLSKLITAKEGYTLDVTYSHTTNGLNYCGTGTVINVYDDYGNFVISYTLVVNGDINGDSVCNALDVTDTERMSTDALTFSALQAYAANGSPKEIVDVSSYQYVLNKALAE
ncbi:MAG: Ig domain-containing protein [Clostridia bacterium]|nr:Ig domain-containing protein [Clostridia bacterium]